MKTSLILQNKHFNCLLCELQELEKNREYCKHDITHLIEVARIMLLINKKETLNIDHDLIIATALLHDIGRVNGYKLNIDHRLGGIEDITLILTECGYTNAQISKILKAISNHNKLNTDTLSSLLYRADKLSRPCYTCKAKNCYWKENIKNKEYYK